MTPQRREMRMRNMSHAPGAPWDLSRFNDKYAWLAGEWGLLQVSTYAQN